MKHKNNSGHLIRLKKQSYLKIYENHDIFISICRKLNIILILLPYLFGIQVYKRLHLANYTFLGEDPNQELQDTP